MADPHRLNVSITRAKMLLIVLIDLAAIDATKKESSIDIIKEEDTIEMEADDEETLDEALKIVTGY